MWTSNKRGLTLVTAAFVASVFPVPPAHGAAYVWNSTSGGMWSDTTSTGWNTSGTDYPRAAGDAVTIAQPLTSNATITIDNTITNATAGSLILTGASSYKWTIAGSVGHGLTLQASSGSASISNTLGANVISAPLTLASNLGTDVSAGSLTISGAIGGSGTLSKTGSGTLTLQGASNFTGNTIVTGGIVGVRTGSALGSSSNTMTVESGGRLDVGHVSGGSLTISNPIVINGTGGGNGALRYIIWGGVTLNGKLTLGSDSLVMQNSGVTNDLRFNNGIDLANHALTFRAADWGAGYFLAATAITGTGGSLNIEHGGNNGQTYVTMSAANTYTGLTTVRHSKATLFLNGSIAGDLSVTMGNLGGTGVVNAANITTIGNGSGTADAIVDPGGAISSGSGARTYSVGTLTMGDLILNSDAKYSLQINSNTLTSDLLLAHGDVTIDPNAQLAISDLGTTALTEGSLTIIQTLDGGTIAGTFKDYADGAQLVVGSNTYTIYYQSDRVTISIPEPSTMTAALGVMSLLSVRRHRPRR